MTPSLSIIIPAYNERDKIARTIETANRFAQEAGDRFETEIVVVDDGSADETSAAAAAAPSELPVSVVRLPVNEGLFSARLHGLERARGDYILLLDAGAILDEGGLSFIASRLPDAAVWNGHTHMQTRGRPFEQFWDIVTSVAFAEYQANPRTTRYGIAEFDRYPKGLGCFFAPRAVLVNALTRARSYYADTRHASDDTAPLRWIAEEHGINISPSFAYTYTFGEDLQGFVRHAFHRGIHFLDSHGRRESRFMPFVLAFYPVSLVLLGATFRRPLVAPASLAAVGAAGAVIAIRHRRSPVEVANLAWLAPLYVIASGLGMWRGLGMAVAERLRQRRS